MFVFTQDDVIIVAFFSPVYQYLADYHCMLIMIRALVQILNVSCIRQELLTYSRIYKYVKFAFYRYEIIHRLN